MDARRKSSLHNPWPMLRFSDLHCACCISLRVFSWVVSVIRVFRCVLLYWSPDMVYTGQVRVRMRAIALPARTAFTVYYLNGSSTAQVGLGYLPSCRAKGINVGGNAQYLRLTNTDTGAISAERGGFTLLHTAATTLLWNTSAHPTLNPTITGLYRCSSDVGDVTGTYRLNVVGVCARVNCVSF